MLNEASADFRKGMVASTEQRITGKAPVLEPRPEVTKMERILQNGFQVKFRRNIKLTTIIRFLLAKLVFDPEGLHIEDFLALYEAVNKGLDHRDPHFQQKWKNWLITVLSLLNKVGQSRIWPLRATAISSELVRGLVPYLPSPSAYYGYKKNHDIAAGYVLQIRNPLLPVPKTPPPRYLGVGYKDKGTRRDPAVDGTFPWQYYAGDRTKFGEEPTLWEDLSLEELVPKKEDFW